MIQIYIELIPDNVHQACHTVFWIREARKIAKVFPDDIGDDFEYVISKIGGDVQGLESWYLFGKDEELGQKDEQASPGPSQILKTMCRR